MDIWENLAELSLAELQDAVDNLDCGILGKDLLKHEIEDIGAEVIPFYSMMVINEDSKDEVRWEHYLSVVKCDDVSHDCRWKASQKYRLYRRRDRADARAELYAWLRDSSGLDPNDPTMLLKLLVAASLGGEFANEFAERIQWNTDY